MISWSFLLARDRGGLNGWVEAALFVLAISTLNIVYALAAELGAHPLLFALYGTAFAAAGSLLGTGLGADWLKVIRAKESWVFGVASIAMEAFYFLLLGTLTPAEASLTVRLAVPASILVGWLFFSRTINGAIVAGSLIVTAAVIPIIVDLAPDVQMRGAIYTVICAGIISIKTFSSEFHPWNRAAKSVGEKMRITGLVVLATAMVGAGICTIAIALELAGLLSANGLVPPLQAFEHLPTFVLALLFGGPILLAMNYLMFSSVVKIGTENFLACSTFAPLVAVALQSLAVSYGIITVPAFNWGLLPLIALGISGVFLIIRGGQSG